MNREVCIQHNGYCANGCSNHFHFPLCQGNTYFFSNFLQPITYSENVNEYNAFIMGNCVQNNNLGHQDILTIITFCKMLYGHHNHTFSLCHVCEQRNLLKVWILLHTCILPSLFRGYIGGKVLYFIIWLYASNLTQLKLKNKSKIVILHVIMEDERCMNDDDGRRTPTVVKLSDSKNLKIKWQYVVFYQIVTNITSTLIN